MRKKIKYGLLALLVFSLWRACTFKTKDKYVLPNGFKGFFAVIYRDVDPKPEKVDGFRVFKIHESGVCDSPFRFAVGAFEQTFLFQNGEQTIDIGSQVLGRLDLKVNEDEFQTIKDNPDSLFAIKFHGGSDGNDTRPQMSFYVYLIDTGSAILKLQQKSSYYFAHLPTFGNRWPMDKNSMEQNIKLLNEAYKNNEYPFEK